MFYVELCQIKNMGMVNCKCKISQAANIYARAQHNGQIDFWSISLIEFDVKSVTLGVNSFLMGKTIDFFLRNVKIRIQIYPVKSHPWQ